MDEVGPPWGPEWSEYSEFSAFVAGPVSAGPGLSVVCTCWFGGIGLKSIGGNDWTGEGHFSLKNGSLAVSPFSCTSRPTSCGCLPFRQVNPLVSLPSLDEAPRPSRRPGHGLVVGLVFGAALAVTGTWPTSVCRGAETIRIGMHFVEPGNEVPLDFLNVLDLSIHRFKHWKMTDPDSSFVRDGAFAGLTEEQVQAEIVRRVREKYYTIPTPENMELNIDIVSRPVSGENSLNVALGEYNFDSSGDAWFGQAELREIFDDPNGGTMAAIAVDELAKLPGPFDTPEKAFNAIVNVSAHEIGHLYGLNHVCAVAGCTGCAGGCAVAKNPFDVMATGPTGLPVHGWLENNVFTDVPRTQGNLSTVGLLIKNAGLRRIGDTDLDDDVDSSDLTQQLLRWTGDLDYNAGDRLWRDGDFDHDQDVDAADLTTTIQHWTVGNAQASDGDTSSATLAYDPATGDVHMSVDGNRRLASFVISATSDVIAVDQVQLPWNQDSGLFDAMSSQIGQYRMDDRRDVRSHPLGAFLPDGLSQSDLWDLLDRAAYAWEGGGGGEFRLTLVPEPSAVLAMIVGLTLAALRHRSRFS